MASSIVTEADALSAASNPQGHPPNAPEPLDNIVQAIRQGIVTATTKAMLEDAERRVTACRGCGSGGEATARRPGGRGEDAIDRYLKDLRATLATDTDEARRLLARGFERIVLRRDEHGGLRAHVEGNLAGLLDLEGAAGLLEVVPEERHPLQSVWPVVRVKVA